MPPNSPLQNQVTELITISNEALLDVSSFTDFFSSFMNKIVSVLNTPEIIPLTVDETSIKEAIKLSNKRTSIELSTFTVVVPEYSVGLILPYYQTLAEALTHLRDVNERLLKPLEKWAASMISVPGYGEKVWTGLPAVHDKTDMYREKLTQYFNDITGDSVRTRPFLETYKDSHGLNVAMALLEKLTMESVRLLDGKISKQSSVLSELIHKLNSTTDVKNLLSQVPTEKMEQVVGLINQASKELELLAIVLFSIKTAGQAAKETIAKINKQLR